MRILSLAKLRSLQRVVPSLLLFGISFSIYTLLFGIKVNQLVNPCVFSSVCLSQIFQVKHSTFQMQASNQIGSLFHEEGQNVIRDVDVTTSGPSETKGTPGKSNVYKQLQTTNNTRYSLWHQWKFYE